MTEPRVAGGGPAGPVPPWGLTDLVALPAILALVTAAVAHHATQVFDFFDMSVLMDAGYRIHCGQHPYLDFYFNAGPVHLYLHALFFRFQGFGTTALVSHVCVLNALVMAGTYAVSRRHFGSGLAALLTVLGGLCYYGIIAHPWYNQSACLWLIGGVIALEALLPLDTPARAACAGGLLGLAAALTLMTRVDFGAGAVLAFAVALAWGPPRRAAAAGLAAFALGLAAGLSAVLATLPSVAEFLFQMNEYVPRTRLLFWPRLVEVAGRTPTLLLLAAALVHRPRRPTSPAARASSSRFALLVALLATSAFTAYTSYMRLSSNVVLLGIELYLFAVLALGPGGAAYAPGRRAARLGVGALLAAGIAVAAHRMHTRDVWAWRSANLEADYALRSAPLAGWRCNRRMGEAVDAAVEAIRTRVPAGDSLFVFPDTTVIYALTGRDSYRGAPAIFLLSTRESSPPAGALAERFRAHFLANPPRWILLHHETESEITHTARFLAWLRLDAFVRDRYRRVDAWNDLELLQMNSLPISASPYLR